MNQIKAYGAKAIQRKKQAYTKGIAWDIFFILQYFFKSKQNQRVRSQDSGFFCWGGGSA